MARTAVRISSAASASKVVNLPTISLAVEARDATGVTEFMISCVRIRISFCQDCTSCSSSSALMFWMEYRWYSPFFSFKIVVRTANWRIRPFTTSLTSWRSPGWRPSMATCRSGLNRSMEDRSGK